MPLEKEGEGGGRARRRGSRRGGWTEEGGETEQMRLLQLLAAVLMSRGGGVVDRCGCETRQGAEGTPAAQGSNAWRMRRSGAIERTAVRCTAVAPRECAVDTFRSTPFRGVHR